MTAPPDEHLFRDYVDALTLDIHRSLAVIALAAGGLERMVEQITGIPITPENPDPLISVGAGDPNLPTSTVHGAIRRSELIEWTQPRGRSRVELLLQHQWIVATYSAWQNEQRPTIAAMFSVEREQVRSHVFGDLRLLRNDIVHHRGLATAANAGRCKLLPPRPAGEVIRLESTDLAVIANNVRVTVAPTH